METTLDAYVVITFPFWLNCQIPEIFKLWFTIITDRTEELGHKELTFGKEYETY